MEKDKDFVSLDRRCGDLQGAGVVVGGFARKLLGKKAFIEADVIANWANIVGDELAELTRPIKIEFKKDERRNGVLHIEAASGALALELQQRSTMVLNKVNVFFGYDAVARLKIIQNLQLIKDVAFVSDNSEKKLVSIEEENYIKQQSAGVKNPELRSALEQLGLALISKNANSEN